MVEVPSCFASLQPTAEEFIPQMQNNAHFTFDVMHPNGGSNATSRSDLSRSISLCLQEEKSLRNRVILKGKTNFDEWIPTTMDLAKSTLPDSLKKKMLLQSLTGEPRALADALTIKHNSSVDACQFGIILKQLIATFGSIHEKIFVQIEELSKIRWDGKSLCYHKNLNTNQ